MLPYSRLVNSPGNSFAQEPSEVFILPSEHMRAMTQECPELTAILVHRMVDRAREFTSNELHDEKLISLGRSRRASPTSSTTRRPRSSGARRCSASGSTSSKARRG